MAEEEKKPEKTEKTQKIEAVKPKAQAGPNVVVIIFGILAFQALVAFLVVVVAIPKEKDDFGKISKKQDDTLQIEDSTFNISIEGEVVLPVKADMVVNISGTDGSRFLKVKISIAYDGKEPKNKNIELGLAKLETQIKSRINEYLSSLTLSQVNDRNAISNVRTALLPELNALIPNSVGKLSNVYVEEFIIQ